MGDSDSSLPNENVDRWVLRSLSAVAARTSKRTFGRFELTEVYRLVAAQIPAGNLSETELTILIEEVIPTRIYILLDRHELLFRRYGRVPVPSLDQFKQWILLEIARVKAEHSTSPGADEHSTADGTPSSGPIDSSGQATGPEDFEKQMPDRFCMPSAAQSRSMTSSSDRVLDTDTSEPNIDFQKCQDVWIVTFQRRATQHRHLVGVAYLAYLVARPGRDITALELRHAVSGLKVAGVQSSSGEAIDEKAKAAYKARLQELDSEIAEAERNNDSGTLQRFRAEKEYLLDEIHRTVGLGGRIRSVGDTAEQARSSVRNAIKRAIQSIRESDQALAEHLTTNISFGRTLCYQSKELS